MEKINNYSNYKLFVNSLKDEIKDVHGDEYENGSLYAYYVHIKLNLPIDENYEPVYEKGIDDIYKLQDFNFDLDGVYSFLTENPTELNYFTIVISGENLKLYSVYGGQKGLVIITENKNIWLEKLKKLYLLNNVNENKIELYKNIYGIKKVYFDELNLDNFSFNYTYIPY